MGAYDVFERVLIDGAAHHLGHFTIFVEQDEGDVRHAMFCSKCATVGGFDIRHEELVAVIVIGPKGAAGLVLKDCAKLAVWVVDLDNGRQAVTDFGQVCFADGGLNGANGKEASPAHNRCGDGEVAQKAEGFAFLLICRFDFGFICGF